MLPDQRLWEGSTVTYMTNDARQAATWVGEHVKDPMTKAVCLVALKSVGRLHWANGQTPAFSLLAPGNLLNTGGIGCVCYTAPVAFALMANAISFTEANKYHLALNSAVDPNNEAKIRLYDRVQGSLGEAKSAKEVIPGSMVFHGRPGNDMAHVTLGIGNGLVVSTWGAGIAVAAMDKAGQEIALRQINELTPPTQSVDTLVVPADCFTDTNTKGRTLRYTTKPFWELWTTSTGGQYKKSYG
jgi:hypothetical protein